MSISVLIKSVPLICTKSLQVKKDTKLISYVFLSKFFNFKEMVKNNINYFRQLFVINATAYKSLSVELLFSTQDSYNLLSLLILSGNLFYFINPYLCFNYFFAFK